MRQVGHERGGIVTEKIRTEGRLYGQLLYFFAGYTVTIKYVLPVGWAVIQRVAWTRYIYFWDAWWIFHLAVGFGLQQGKKGTWYWALALTLAELVIIAVKLSMYVMDPISSFWHINWLVNKSLLFVYFCFLLVWALRRDVREVY